MVHRHSDAEHFFWGSVIAWLVTVKIGFEFKVKVLDIRFAFALAYVLLGSHHLQSVVCVIAFLRKHKLLPGFPLATLIAVVSIIDHMLRRRGVDHLLVGILHRIFVHISAFDQLVNVDRLISVR